MAQRGTVNDRRPPLAPLWAWLLIAVLFGIWLGLAVEEFKPVDVIIDHWILP
jgi:Na+/H+-dicarboxylate symporter